MVEDADIILVAVMKDPRDLEIARVLGWYRIPSVARSRPQRATDPARHEPPQVKRAEWDT